MENQNLKRYSEQIALVTGASRGIGRAVAVALARSGRYVYINYKNNEAAAKETLLFIESHNVMTLNDENHNGITLNGIALNDENQNRAGDLICFDVTSQEDCEAAIKSIIAKHGKIDILVNNSGVKDDKLLVMMKKSSWGSVIDVNLNGFYNVTKLAVKNMIKNQFGRIVNITSASGQIGVAGQVNYSASKAGLIGATKALAKEVASRNITVNAVAPGFIATDMTESLALEKIADSIPAKRVGKPEDVASAVVFLCSDEASYITGQVLGVNGGIC